MPRLTSDHDDDVHSNCENIIDPNCRAGVIIISSNDSMAIIDKRLGPQGGSQQEMTDNVIKSSN